MRYLVEGDFGPAVGFVKLRTLIIVVEDDDRVRAGEGPQDMLQGGALDGLPRKWKDPLKFLYAAAKGGWGYYDKLGENVG